MRGASARFATPLRQYGGVAQAFSRRHDAAVAERRARRQASLRLHVDGQPARRPGDDAHIDDAAAPASRHDASRHPLHRDRVVGHTRRRHTLRRLARVRRGRTRVDALAGRESARRCARRAACAHGVAAGRPPMKPAGRAAQQTPTVSGSNGATARNAYAIGAAAALVALIVLALLWERWLAPLRPGGSALVFKALPLAFALPGVLRRRLY